MPTKIQRWGNSQGLRVPKEVLAEANLEIGDAVDVRAVDGTLVVTPLRRVRGRLDLADLVAAMPPDTISTEVPWGEAEGDEF
ncbi:MAG: AbrB/MazE/SpoVT family DNA-binding domain-containing protein [Trueperaceae bacterium]|nr:MAG: AbrB/MazE/SpoVT family DNA-binding domain-containing protein [Trueperaceae bacterium]